MKNSTETYENGKIQIEDGEKTKDVKQVKTEIVKAKTSIRPQKGPANQT